MNNNMEGTEIKFRKVPIEELILDRKNPRFPDEFRPDSDLEILNWMLNEEAVTDLMASISENGFFEGEPLVVVPSEIVTGKFDVIEGNRRLSAVKLLTNPDQNTVSPITVKQLSEQAALKNTIPTELPVFVASNREQVISYLSFRHISGVKSWPMISKARFAYKLYSDQIDKIDQKDLYKSIANKIGSKAHYVKRLIIGYQAFLKIRSIHYKTDNIDISESKFNLSLLTSALTKYSNIVSYIGIDAELTNPFLNINVERFNRLVGWLYSNKKIVIDDRQLPDLNQVLGNQKSIDILEKYDDLKYALTLSGDAYNRFFSKIEEIENEIKNADELLNSLTEVSGIDINRINRLIELTERLHSSAKRKLRDSVNV